jgi:lipoprotein-anchoring transpeptidase ErfK/SrfK
LNTLTLKANGEVLKVYSVGTGVEGSTPVGDFKIVNKLENPPWHHDGKVVPFGDPENILGTRWMGFDLKGYGIHGTSDPGSVGSQSSAGCVRLRNEEVEELYKIVPVGTMVTVVE